MRASPGELGYSVRRSFLKGVQLDFYRTRFYCMSFSLVSFLAKHCGVNLPRADYIRVLRAKILYADLDCFLVEKSGIGVLFFAIIE